MHLHTHTLNSGRYTARERRFSMHLDETFNKRSLMQISMNQGTDYRSKIGWLRDVTPAHKKWWIPFVNFSFTLPLSPASYILLYLQSWTNTVPSITCLAIKQKSKAVNLSGNNKWSGQIALYWPFHLTVREPRERMCEMSLRTGKIKTKDFIFLFC